jgi:hypothetical protein
MTNRPAGAVWLFYNTMTVSVFIDNGHLYFSSNLVCHFHMES